MGLNLAIENDCLIESLLTCRRLSKDIRLLIEWRVMLLVKETVLLLRELGSTVLVLPISLRLILFLLEEPSFVSLALSEKISLDSCSVIDFWEVGEKGEALTVFLSN